MKAAATTAPRAALATSPGALAAPLDRAHVKQRDQGRGKLSYLEVWQVIAEANRLFGFDGWQRESIEVRCVNQAEGPIGRQQRSGWDVT